MLMDKKAIIEYVKEKIIQMRAEGKLDFERTTGASLRLDFYRDLYPGKVHPSIKVEEERNPGILDRIISEGIGLGLTAPARVQKIEDVSLTESELKGISWDVRMAMGKKGLTGDDPSYNQEYQELSKQMETERLAEKKAKLLPKKEPNKNSVPEKILKTAEVSAYSAAELEMVNALTYVEDFKKLLQDPTAISEAYFEMDRDFLLVWERREREGMSPDLVLMESLAEVAPSRPRQKEEKIELAQKFWQLFGTSLAKSANNIPTLAEKMRATYRDFMAGGLDKNHAMKGTYRSFLNLKDPIINQIREQVFAQLFPHPIETRFKRSFHSCRKPSQVNQSPLPMGEALKTALERALTMAPSLQKKKAILDIMSRESRAFMPSGKLKKRKTP